MGSRGRALLTVRPSVLSILYFKGMGDALKEHRHHWRDNHVDSWWRTKAAPAPWVPSGTLSICLVRTGKVTYIKIYVKSTMDELQTKESENEKPPKEWTQ